MNQTSHLKMIEKLKHFKIYILYGGDSPEREISLKTGENIYQTLKEKKLNVHLIDCKSVNSFDKNLIDNKSIFFIALHGGFGEDGTLQKILEENKAYFTGSGEYASKAAMNKLTTKKIAQEYGIHTANYLHFTFNDLSKINTIPDFIGFPLVVKPVNLGSTIGINVCRNFNQLKNAINQIKPLDKEFLVEEFLSGEEVTVPVLRKEVLSPIRLCYNSDIFDYNLKYKEKKVEYQFLEKNYKNIDTISLKIFNALKCYSYARIDFKSDGNLLYLLEVNTLPGLTSVSLFPKSAKKCGIEFDQLLLMLLDDAIKRYDTD